MFTIGRLDIGIRTRGAGTPPVPAAPASTSAPAITGSPIVGASLSCSTGGWTGFPAPTFTYQWIWADTSANISGATSSTYTPISGDLGHTLKCAVTATNSQGNATANSNTTAAVAQTPVNTVAPAVTGTTAVSQTLSTTNGTWTNTPTSYAYQWKWADTGANISGATASTYVLVSGDVGHTIKCTVTATNAAGSASADSNTTAAVTAGVTPAFQADFTALSALPTGVSFSRASNAMVSDSTGKLTYAPNNILLQSNNFSTTWSTVTATVSSGVSDPDGGTNASTLTATANGALLYQQVTIDGNYVNSIQIRRRTGSGAVSLRTPDNSVVAIGLSVTGSWQRFFVNGPAAGGPVYTFALVIATSGDAVDIYQAQGERVTYETTPRAYNPTTTAPYYGPRFDFAWNGSAWVATGLLIEEQRTNICTHSNDFTSGVWSKGSGTVTSGIAAPDGTLTAFTYTSGANNDALAQAIAVINATVYSDTFWVRRRTGSGFIGALDPSNGSYNDITSQVTSTWAKITLIGTSSGTLAYAHLILGVAGDAVDIAWFDLEQGAFATSYIPTTTAAATRSADIVTLVGAADAAAKSASGTFFVEVGEMPLATPSTNQVILSSANHFPIFRDHSTNKPELYSYHDGASIGVFADAVAGGWGVPNRIGVAHDTTSVSIVANGTTVATGTGTEDWASDGTIWLGSLNGAQAINGHARFLAIYNVRRSNADLQTISVVGAAF